MKTSFKIGLGCVIGVLLIFFIFMITCIKTIQPGYAGIVYDMNGGLENTTLSQGMHLIPPWKQVTSYPISTETVYFSKSNSEGGNNDESVNPGTGDGKTVNMDVSYTYHYDVNKLPHIFTKFRGQSAEDISNNYIRQYMKDAINGVTTQYGVFDIYGTKRQEVANKIYKDFEAKTKADGIVVESFSIVEVRPDSDTMKGIQEKVNAEQALKTAQIKQEQAKVDAETAILKAQGEAKANQILEQSINQDLINYNKWNKWDGKLPSTVAGADSSILIDGSSAEKK